MPQFLNVFLQLFSIHVLLYLCFSVFARYVTKACIVSFFFLSPLMLCVSFVTTFVLPFSASCMMFCFITYVKLDIFIYLFKFCSSYSFLLLKCIVSGITVILGILCTYIYTCLWVFLRGPRWHSG